MAKLSTYSAKTTPVSGDMFVLVDSEDANNTKLVDFDDMPGGGYAPGGTDVAVADGGTGASTAAAACVNLGALTTLSGDALLSSTTVNTNTGTKQALYTVPGGKKAIPTKVIVRSASTSLGAMSAGLTFGFNAGADDFGTGFGSASLALLLDATTAILSANDVSFGGGAPIVIGNAADVFGCLFNDTSITGTVKVDVFGYIY